MINDILIWVTIVLLLVIDIKNIRRINWCKNIIDLAIIKSFIKELEEEEVNKNEI